MWAGFPSTLIPHTLSIMSENKTPQDWNPGEKPVLPTQYYAKALSDGDKNYKVWVYSFKDASPEGKVVGALEAEKLLKRGWFFSPADAEDAYYEAKEAAEAAQAKVEAGPPKVKKKKPGPKKGFKKPMSKVAHREPEPEPDDEEETEETEED